MKSAWILLLAIVFSGCTTLEPYRSDHHGLFDRSPGSLSGGYSKAVRRIPFHWPLARVEITSPFGPRGSEFHEGVDLRARRGTSVYAAQAGVVIYAGATIRGYGKMIVIRHRYGWATVYAHNSRLLVHKGQFVKRGQRISMSGNTGHSTGPHLHFEIRSGATAVNPIRLLSSR